MKSIFSLIPATIILLLLSACKKESSYIVIPDNNFLSALVELGVDKNQDGKISLGEAESVNTLFISSKGISDLTGLEYFINLDTMDCQFNSIIKLNVSNNSMLKFLRCNISGLYGLDLSNNHELRYLYCGGGFGGSKQLSVIDISRNTKLEYLNCWGNQLTSLDITNNIGLKTLNLSLMPTLNKVYVWSLFQQAIMSNSVAHLIQKRLRYILPVLVVL